MSGGQLHPEPAPGVATFTSGHRFFDMCTCTSLSNSLLLVLAALGIIYRLLALGDGFFHFLGASPLLPFL